MMAPESAPVISHLGSLKFTLWLFALFALTVTVAYQLPGVSNSWLALPLIMLAINLLAAVIINPRFRQQLPLLTFHLALLLLLLLIAMGQLSRLKGHVEITKGEQFAGELTDYTAGPLHQWRLKQIQLLLEDFSINYAPGLQREETRSHLKWLGKDGNINRGVIGDHRPLILEGYRFYTSHNKGFAPIFTWQPINGESITGSIHLPAYPANEFRQALEWSPTGSGLKIWTQLQFDEVILDHKSHSQFRTPSEHTLIVRIDDARHEIKPGGMIELSEGRLVYDELRTWMGFSVSSDWTLPWLFASGFLAVMSMGWHYWRKYNRQPWLQR